MRCATGEDWNLIMSELANGEGYGGVTCIKHQSFESQQAEGYLGCGTNISYLYFLSFMVIISMLIMNLSVAAVIEGLETARKENTGIVQNSHLDTLYALWEEFDPTATGWIEVKDLAFFLNELPFPFAKENYKPIADNEKEADCRITRAKTRK